MYIWNNEKKLKTLSVDAKEGILIFETPRERAEVYFSPGKIEKIVHTTDGKETIILSADAQYVTVGEKHWTRDVYHFLKPNGVAPELRLGITVHRGEGTMSSLPHHFELHPEPDFEEVFFYMLDGGRKRAVQVAEGMWFDGTPVDEVWPIKDKSFSTIPIGYHPVMAEPGVNVSYIWAYLAKYPRWEKV